MIACGMAVMPWWWWAMIYAFFGLAAVLDSLGAIAEVEDEFGPWFATGVAIRTFLLWPLALAVALFTKAFR